MKKSVIGLFVVLVLFAILAGRILWPDMDEEFGFSPEQVEQINDVLQKQWDTTQIDRKDYWEKVLDEAQIVYPEQFGDEGLEWAFRDQTQEHGGEYAIIAKEVKTTKTAYKVWIVLGEVRKVSDQYQVFWCADFYEVLPGRAIRLRSGAEYIQVMDRSLRYYEWVDSVYNPDTQGMRDRIWGWYVKS